jgi:hypothetical protein
MGEKTGRSIEPEGKETILNQSINGIQQSVVCLTHGWISRTRTREADAKEIMYSITFPTYWQNIVIHSNFEVGRHRWVQPQRLKKNRVVVRSYFVMRCMSLRLQSTTCVVLWGH